MHDEHILSYLTIVMLARTSKIIPGHMEPEHYIEMNVGHIVRAQSALPVNPRTTPNIVFIGKAAK